MADEPDRPAERVMTCPQCGFPMEAACGATCPNCGYHEPCGSEP